MSKHNIIYGSIKRKIVASDLLAERANRDFDNENGDVLANALDTNDFYKELKKMDEDCQADPILRNTHKFYEMSSEEMQEYQMKRLRRAFELKKKEWFVDHDPSKMQWNYLILGEVPAGVHQSMFCKCLQSLTTEEQGKKWIPLAQNMEIMGAYAQTELGHGSDIAGLQTTATYDQSTDEFVIHTPSIMAIKFWPGDLGFFSSHAIVFAKLIIEGNKYGVYPFIVHMRDTKTWKLEKGVKAGDIGPKFGFNSKNNGWCSFDNVRIPRENMLMKYTKVEPDGSFSICGDVRGLYSAMMDIRVQLLGHSCFSLEKALTIALRYSVIRRQFKNNLDNPKTETKLLDYQTQQMKLLPLLAISFAMKWTFRDILLQYSNLLDDVKRGVFDNLDEMHHLSSGFKSLFTQMTMDGLMVIRQSIGGAGYTAWSGIPHILVDFASATTYEGDNTVMAQQSFRYLQKLYKKARQNKPVGKEYEYLHNIDHLLQLKCQVTTPESFCDIEQIDQALEACTAAIVHNTIENVLMSKESQKEITNHTQALEIVICSLAHLKYLMFKKFKKNISLLKDKKLQGHVTNLCSLTGLMFLQQCLTAGYDSGYFKKGDQQLVQKAFELLLKKIRPQAIPLVELGCHSDHVLTSAIGNSYGDIYETYFEWAKTSKLNDQKDNIPAHFHQHLAPILQGKL